MLYELFIVGGWFFWTLISICCCSFIVFLNKLENDRERYNSARDSFSWFVVCSFIAIVLTMLFSDLSIKSFFANLYQHRWDYLFNASIYLAIGIIWMIFKWEIRIHRLVNEAKDRITSAHRKMDRNDLQNYQSSMSVSNNKDKLSCWLLAWPLSVVMFLFRDLFSTISNWTISAFSWIMEFRSRRMFKKLNDFNEKFAKQTDSTSL
jgi:amino acid permease